MLSVALVHGDHDDWLMSKSKQTDEDSREWFYNRPIANGFSPARRLGESLVESKHHRQRMPRTLACA